MPRTAITPQPVTSGGLSPATEPANVDGNSFRPYAGRMLHVKNASAAPVTVTIPTPGTVDGLAVADRAVAVPAAGESLIGLGAAAAYREPNGTVLVNYSAVASVTVAVLDIP